MFETRLDGLPVLRVVATHMHPDHLGLAHWLTERWGCGLWISSTDWLAARLAVQSTLGHGGVSAAEHFARHGLRDPEAQRKVRARGSYYASMVPAVPARHHRLIDGRRAAAHRRARLALHRRLRPRPRAHRPAPARAPAC